jgi:hypothetical protein
MTIRNLSSTIQMKPTTHSIVLVALQPQPLKLRDIPSPQKSCQRAYDLLFIQSVLEYLLLSLTNA